MQYVDVFLIMNKKVNEMIIPIYLIVRIRRRKYWWHRNVRGRRRCIEAHGLGWRWVNQTSYGQQLLGQPWLERGIG